MTHPDYPTRPDRPTEWIPPYGYPGAAYPPAPPAPKRRSHRAAWMVAGIVASLIVLCTGLALIGNAIKPTAATLTMATTSASPSATQASPTPAATKAAPTTPAAKPSPTPKSPSMTDQLSAWFTNGGQTHLTTISGALDQISTAGNNSDVAGMKEAAVALGVAVKAAQQYAPLPDPTCQRYWSLALGDFADAAQNIYVGITTVDSVKLTTANSDMTAGTEQLRLLTARVNKLKG